MGGALDQDKLVGVLFCHHSVASVRNMTARGAKLNKPGFVFPHYM